MNQHVNAYYAHLDAQDIKIVPEFEYDFECRGWAKDA